jgi:hypothetical protein
MWQCPAIDSDWLIGEQLFCNKGTTRLSLVSIPKSQQYIKTSRLLESSNAGPDSLDGFPASFLDVHGQGQNDLYVRMKELCFVAASQFDKRK